MTYVPRRWILRERESFNGVSELWGSGPSIPEGEVMVMPVREFEEYRDATLDRLEHERDAAVAELTQLGSIPGLEVAMIPISEHTRILKRAVENAIQLESLRRYHEYRTALKQELRELRGAAGN